MMRYVLVAMTLLLARQAAATRVLPVTLDTLSHEADLVVDGDAGPSISFWVGGRIFTRVEVTLRDTWKGASRERTVSVVLRGGVVDGIGQRVDGEAVLHTGDHTVLFLRYDAQLAGYRPVALEQGVFRIREHDDARPARLQRADVVGFERQVRELTRGP